MSTQSAPHSRPKVAITVGDVAGVGPELALKCTGLSDVNDLCVPAIVGPFDVLQDVAQKLDLPCPERVCSFSEVSEKAVIVDVGDISSEDFRPGQVNKSTGQASFDAVDQSISAAIAGEVDAIATGPIHKEAWREAGIQFPGHTELLADRTGTSDYCMMLTSDEISCVLVTIHIPLADVPRQLSIDNIIQAIRLGSDALARRHRRPARITVCGLNPHAGENGLFSHGEENNLIVPAIKRADRLGIQVKGPVPPDTAFTPMMRRETDVYICMYHDQGLIPLKALSFDDAVNVTLGLPIVRTSVDHGTALDLAWQGKANHQSFVAAIRMAVDLSK